MKYTLEIYLHKQGIDFRVTNVKMVIIDYCPEVDIINDNSVLHWHLTYYIILDIKCRYELGNKTIDCVRKHVNASTIILYSLIINTRDLLNLMACRNSRRGWILNHLLNSPTHEAMAYVRNTTSYWYMRSITAVTEDYSRYYNVKLRLTLLTH